MRFSAAATSSIGTSVSITGRMPPAILSRLSAILRIVAPNEPKIRYCCWNNCIRLRVVVGPEVEPQVTSRPPRFKRQQRAVEGVGADMFEHDVDTLFPGYPAGLVLEAILAIVDDVVGAERFHAADFGVIADGGDDGAADGLGHHDGDGADAGAPGMDKHGFARVAVSHCRTACAERLKMRSARRPRRVR